MTNTTEPLAKLDRSNLPAPVALADHVNRKQAVADFAQGRRDSGPQARLAWLADFDTAPEARQRHRAMTGYNERLPRPKTDQPLTRAEKLNVWALVLMLSAAASLGAGPVALTQPNFAIAAVFGVLGLAFGAWSLIVERRRAAGKHVGR